MLLFITIWRQSVVDSSSSQRQTPESRLECRSQRKLTTSVETRTFSQHEVVGSLRLFAKSWAIISHLCLSVQHRIPRLGRNYHPKFAIWCVLELKGHCARERLPVVNNVLYRVENISGEKRRRRRCRSDRGRTHQRHDTRDDEGNRRTGL